MVKCPNCNSSNVRERNIGKKTGGVAGGVGGALAAQRSKQLRVFRKLDTLVLYLQQIGVCRFEVDATGFMGAPRQIRSS